VAVVPGERGPDAEPGSEFHHARPQGKNREPERKREVPRWVPFDARNVRFVDALKVVRSKRDGQRAQSVPTLEAHAKTVLSAIEVMVIGGLRFAVERRDEHRSRRHPLRVARCDRFGRRAPRRGVDRVSRARGSGECPKEDQEAERRNPRREAHAVRNSNDHAWLPARRTCGDTGSERRNS
jgi:hypothetical protein